MSNAARVQGYKNFEDCDECGFVGPKPPERPSNPLRDAIQIADAERWLVRQLDELLERPLGRHVIDALRRMRVAQMNNVERCEALIKELAHTHPSGL